MRTTTKYKNDFLIVQRNAFHPHNVASHARQALNFNLYSSAEDENLAVRRKRDQHTSLRVQFSGEFIACFSLTIRNKLAISWIMVALNSLNLYAIPSEENGPFVSLVVQWGKRRESHRRADAPDKHWWPSHVQQRHNSATNPLMGNSLCKSNCLRTFSSRRNNGEWDWDHLTKLMCAQTMHGIWTAVPRSVVASLRNNWRNATDIRIS